MASETRAAETRAAETRAAETSPHGGTAAAIETPGVVDGSPTAHREAETAKAHRG